MGAERNDTPADVQVLRSCFRKFPCFFNFLFLFN